MIGADGKRLIETHDVHRVETGRDLVVHERPATGKGLVIAGGIDFGPSAQQANAQPDDTKVRAGIEAARQAIGFFPALPHSDEEVDAVAALYAQSRPKEPRPVVWKDRVATEGRLKALATAPRVLHLATHGFFLKAGTVDGQPLLQSGVALAGANAGLAGGHGADGENGILHAVEAQTLNLFGTELVVVSACDTGRGVTDYSDGLLGLPSAFYVAGARNVMVALWPVGDRGAAVFMDRFYRIWLNQTTGDPAQALIEAKRHFARQTDKAFNDPRFWAGFALFEG